MAPAPKTLLRENYLYLDFETGGLFPRENLKTKEHNTITQICAIALNGQTLEDIDGYRAYAQPREDRYYNPQALTYTGITIAQLKEKGIPQQQLVNDLKDLFIRINPSKGADRYKPTCIAHNAKFDKEFLEVIFEECGLDVYDYIDENWLCTMKMAKQAWNHDQEVKSFALKACCEKADIELVQGHDAINDVIAGIDLFKYFTNRLRSEGSEGGEGGVQIQAKQKDRLTFSF